MLIITSSTISKRIPGKSTEEFLDLSLKIFLDEFLQEFGEIPTGVFRKICRGIREESLE